MKYQLTQQRAQKGFSMVEVLVTLVVLSVGLLGMAALFVTTLRSGSSAIYRMQAVSLAADLADRMRANRLAVTSYKDPAGTSAACLASVCDSATMAANDLYIFNQQVQALLPGSPSGSVAVDTTTSPNTETITISWTEPASSQALSYTLVMQL